MIFSTAVQGEIKINITGGSHQSLPITILPFHIDSSQALPYDIESIVSSDLQRSGTFEIVKIENIPPSRTQLDSINYKYYRLLGAEHVLSGGVRKLVGENFLLNISLYDVLLKRKEWTYEWSFSAKTLRQTAHRISDLIFHHVTGRQSAFSSLIAYVYVQRDEASKKRFYKLQVADTDGFNARTVVRAPSPILSPAWAPDGERLAYVSFESGKSEIFTHDLYKGTRTKVAAHPGINSAPAWSPDGKTLAASLSLHGNSEIYLIDLKTKLLKRLTYHKSIDTEPEFSPDNRYVYFTSDRSGKPHIYRLPVGARKTTTPKRITRSGRYNAGASLSGDGKYLALVHAGEQGLALALHDIERQETEVITNTFLDDSPSISPGGNMLIYSAVDRTSGDGHLVVMDLFGRSKQILRSTKGEVRDPSWGPIIRDIQ